MPQYYWQTKCRKTGEYHTFIGTSKRFTDGYVFFEKQPNTSGISVKVTHYDAAETRARREEVEALKKEVERLHKIFDDAGQGESNILAVLDHFIEHERTAYDAACEFSKEVEMLRRRLQEAESIANAALEVGAKECERLRGENKERRETCNKFRTMWESEWNNHSADMGRWFEWIRETEAVANLAMEVGSKECERLRDDVDWYQRQVRTREERHARDVKWAVECLLERHASDDLTNLAMRKGLAECDSLRQQLEFHQWIAESRHEEIERLRAELAALKAERGGQCQHAG